VRSNWGWLPVQAWPSHCKRIPALVGHAGISRFAFREHIERGPTPTP
jgi:hypothetical protein